MKKKILIAVLTTSALLGTTYFATACGDNTSINNNAIKPIVSISHGAIDGLKDEYKVGEEVNFKITPEKDYYVEKVEINGIKQTETDGGYKYTIQSSDTELNIVVTIKSLYIQVSSTITNGKIVGLKDKYKTGEYVRFTLELDEGYIETNVTLNGNKLNKTGSEYIYQVQKNDTDIKINVEVTRIVTVKGAIKFEEGKMPEFYRNLIDKIIFADKNNNQKIATVNGNANDGFNYEISLTSGEYDVKVYCLTESQAPNYIIYNSKVSVEKDEIVQNIDLIAKDFTRIIEGKNETITKDESNESFKQELNLEETNEQFAAHQNFKEGFTLKFDGKILDGNGEPIMDPTFGKEPDGLVTIDLPKRHEGKQNGSIQIVHRKGNWVAKVFAIDKNGDEVYSEGVLPKEAIKALNSETGLEIRLTRVVTENTATFTLFIELDGEKIPLGKLTNCEVMPFEFIDLKRNFLNLADENKGDISISKHTIAIHKTIEDFTKNEYSLYGRNCYSTNGLQTQTQFWDGQLFGALKGEYRMSFKVGNDALLDDQGKLQFNMDGLSCQIPMWSDNGTNFGLNFESFGDSNNPEFKLYFWSDGNDTYNMRLTDDEIRAFDAQNLEVTFEKIDSSLSIYFTDLEGRMVKKFEKAITDTFFKNQHSLWGDFKVNPKGIGNYKLHDLKVTYNTKKISNMKTIVSTVDKKEVSLKKDTDVYKETAFFDRAYGDTKAHQAMGGKLVVPGIYKDGKIDETKLGSNIILRYAGWPSQWTPFDVILKLNKETKQIELCSGDKILTILNEQQLNLLSTSGLTFGYLHILNKDYLIDFKFYLEGSSVYDITLNYPRVACTFQAAVIAVLDKNISADATAELVNFKFANFSSDISEETMLETVTK